MKKVKYIALIMVVALGLLGGAYAVWSDSLTLSGSVETGYLDHIWHALGHFPNKNSYENGESWHYGTCVAWHEDYLDDPLVIELFNMYPGAEVKFYPSIKNTGTIPSKTANFKVEKTGGSTALYNNIQVKYSMVKYDKDGNRYPDNVVGTTPFMPITELENHLNNNAKGVVLKPGERLSFDENTVYFRVDPNAGNEIQGKNVKFKITFEFEQGV